MHMSDAKKNVEEALNMTPDEYREYVQERYGFKPELGSKKTFEITFTIKWYWVALIAALNIAVVAWAVWS